jgi:type IX secretion system PorP/SprF family membrane protein
MRINMHIAVKVKTGSLLLLLAVCSTLANAQDIHYSQFANSPLNLNPAQTAAFAGDYRIIANQRSQWSAVPVPYSSFSLGADMRNPIKLKNQTTGAGLVLNADKAGDSETRTTQAIASFSWLKKLDRDSTQLISAGVQTGICNKSFNTAKLTFDSQYNGDAYDPNLPSNENFDKTQVTYFDLGMGVNYIFRIKERTSFTIGTSMQHINKPKESFMKDNAIRLKPKAAVNTAYQFKLSPTFDMITSAYVATQGKYKEIVGGVTGKYILDPKENISVYFGNMYRVKDADIVMIGMDYRNLYAGMSYDINLSPLRVATNGRGGFELSFICILQKFVPVRSGKTICPIFM